MYPGERCGVGQRVNWNNWKPERGAAAAPQQFAGTSRPTANRYAGPAKPRPKGGAGPGQCPARVPPPRNPHTSPNYPATGAVPRAQSTMRAPPAAACPGRTSAQDAARAANRAVNAPRPRPAKITSRYGQATLKAAEPPRNPFATWGSSQNNAPWASVPGAPRSPGIRGGTGIVQGGYCPAVAPAPPPCPAAVPQPPPCPAAVPEPPPPGSLAHIQQRLEASRAATRAVMARAQASIRPPSPPPQRVYCPAALPQPPPCPPPAPEPPPCPAAAPSARRPSISVVPTVPSPSPAQNASRRSVNTSRRSTPGVPPPIAQTSQQQRPPPAVSKTVFKQTTTKRLVPPAAKGNAPCRPTGARKKIPKARALPERPAFDTGAPPPVVAVPVERVRDPSLASFAPPLRRQRAAAAAASAAEATAAADAALAAFESRAAAQAQLLANNSACPAAPAREPIVTVPVASVAGCGPAIREIRVPASVANSPEEKIVSVSNKTGVARVLNLSFEKDFGPSRPLKKPAELPPASNALGQFLFNLEEADRIERRELGNTIEDIQRNRRRLLFMGLEGDRNLQNVNEYNKETTSRTMWEERLRSENLMGAADGRTVGRTSTSRTMGVTTSRTLTNRCPASEDDLLDEDIDLLDSDDDVVIEEMEDEDQGISSVSKKVIYELRSSASEEEDEVMDEMYDELVDLQPPCLPYNELQGDDLFEWMRPIGAPLVQVVTTTSRSTWQPGALMDVRSPKKNKDVGEKPSEQLFRLIKLVDLE